MKRRVAARIPASGDGITLLGYLNARFPYHSPEEWLAHVMAGELALDGAICRDPGAVLHTGMLLEYFPENLVEPPVRRDYKILYADETLLVIDKPGNLPVHPAGPYFNHTLWALLQEDGFGEVYLVNRLDRETSGVMLAARTPAAAKRLNAQLGSMHKTYYVLVHGSFPAPVTASGYLIADAGSSIRKKRRFVPGAAIPPGGEAAQTLFTPLMERDGVTLLCAEPQTGRFHQIRATLFSLGYPVVGDKLYGVDETFFHRQKAGTLTALDQARLRLPRQALHCARLEFRHPVTDEIMTWTAPLPAEITRIFPWAQ